MRRTRRRARVLAVLAAGGVALACGGPAEEAAQPSPAPSAPDPPVGAAALPESPEEAAPPPDAAGASGVSDAGLAVEGLETDPPAPGEPEMRIVPLESLLRAPKPMPKPEPRVLDLRDPQEPPAGAAGKTAEKGVTDAVRERVRVERRSEPIGRAGPEQGTYSETEAGVDVPVGEGVKLRGGVRVEQRDEPAEERREQESTPRVGVEIQF